MYKDRVLDFPLLEAVSVKDVLVIPLPKPRHSATMVFHQSVYGRYSLARLQRFSSMMTIRA